MRIFFFCLALSLGLAGCSSSSSRGGYFENDGPPSAVGHLKALGSNDITIRVEQPHKWANRPYTVLGKRYVPVTGDKPMTQVGEASWYGKQFHGKKTSMGEIYDMYALTAAHKTMQLPSYARVTNLKNGRSIIVRVNDRGPFVDDRIIDLSYAAAVQLGYQNQGVTRVRVERITMKDIAAGRIPSTNASDTTVASAAPAAAAASRPAAQKTAAASQTRTYTTVSRTSSTTNSAYREQPAQQRAAAQTSAPAAAPAAYAAAGTGQVAQAEPIDSAAAAEGSEEPAVTISLMVEETGSDEAQAMQTYREMEAQQSVPSAQPARSSDPISAIVAEQNAIEAERAAAARTAPAAAPGGWTVQLGAFGVKDNAAAAAAHAEMMFSQQQRAFGSVRVVDTGSVFRVVVGSVASQPEAIALARSVSSALGSSAFAIAEPAPAR